MNNDRIAQIKARFEAANADLVVEYESGSYISTRGYVTIKESLADIPNLITLLAERETEIDRLTEAARWIPVSERLPERLPKGTQNCLCLFNDGSIAICWFNGPPYHLYADVTHWMLPPAAAEEERGKKADESNVQNM